MKRCLLKRSNFQIINKMSKETQNTDKAENGNDFIADVSERFSSASDYVRYMDEQGHTFKDDFDISRPMSEYPSDFRREYFKREWYRMQTVKKIIKRIEILEGLLNDR